VAPSDKFCLSQVFDYDRSTVYKLVSVFRAVATLGSIVDVSKVNVIFITFQDMDHDDAKEIVTVPIWTDETRNLIYNIYSESVKKAVKSTELKGYKVKIKVT